MSTVTPPKKDKPISDNWINIQGGRNEVPDSFNFTDERTLRKKEKQGYETHYIYKDQKGLTNFVVERKFSETKKNPNGKKQFYLHSKWENKISGQKRWMARKVSEPRPIYNLDKLHNSISNELIIVEGEKAADSYKHPKPITTWACGTYCVLQNDWSPVSSFHKIYLVPDNDDKGREAMNKLAMHLHEDLGVSMDTLYCAAIPKDFPEGWDIADPTPESFKGDGNTIIHNADYYDAVVTDYKSIWNEFKLGKVKKEVQRDREVRLREKGEECIYVRELNELLDTSTDLLVPLKHFDNNLAYLKIGNTNPSKKLLEDEFFKRVDKFTFDPRHKTGIVQIGNIVYANRYKPCTIIPKEYDQTFTHWREQLDYMFGEDADVFEQWLGWIVQNQGEKCMWAPLIISERRGVGKGWLTYIIKKILGQHNVRPNLKYKNVIGRFSNWIIGAQFAVINEVFIANKHGKKMEMSEEIKDFITEPTIHVEEKFRSSYDYNNTCNFLLISNHENCMYINNEERRYWIKVMKVEQRDADYWKEKWDWIKKPKSDDHNEGINFILYHLKKLKITHPEIYTYRAPITSDFTEMAKQSEHQIFRWLDEHLDSESGPFSRGNWYRNFNYMMRATDLHRTCSSMDQQCSLDIVTDWLKRRSVLWNNGEATKQIQLSDGSKPRVYLLPPKHPESARAYNINNLNSLTYSQLGMRYEEKTGERPNYQNKNKEGKEAPFMESKQGS